MSFGSFYTPCSWLSDRFFRSCLMLTRFMIAIAATIPMVAATAVPTPRSDSDWLSCLRYSIPRSSRVAPIRASGSLQGELRIGFGRCARSSMV
ncbi:hypothetical protein F5B20DRAFT_556668 [Whalleya microplaca]|nr:hypothetical protein F5B20DRAFT_556668 [Whalleya microplaca]